jgi:hypothetical protein
MVNFDSINVTTEYWDEDLFHCEATDKGGRLMDEMSARLQGIRTGHQKEYMSIREVEDMYGVKIIGEGIARIVIEIPDSWHTGGKDCVAKIQWDEEYQQMASEIEVWKSANGRVAALLAPMLDWSELSFWGIMPKAELHNDIKPNKSRKIVRKIRKGLRDSGATSKDVRRANVGRIEGRDVLIDYADVMFKHNG